jgi:hypothetical protein
MGEIIYINEEHKAIIEEYLKFIQRDVYDVTENANCGKFSDFQELLDDILRYHNDFVDMPMKENNFDEWIFSIPNLCMFTSLGFYAGLKNKENEKMIQTHIDLIHETTMNTFAVLSDFLNDVEAIKIWKQS